MMTQNEMILDHLRTYGKITPLSALEQYGCMRLAARISDLREQGKQDGFSIDMNMVSSKNRFGQTVSFAEYTYKENKKCNP